MNKDISLLPFSKLMGALASIGLTPPPTKAQAIVDLELAIANGMITRDQVRLALPIGKVISDQGNLSHVTQKADSALIAANGVGVRVDQINAEINQNIQDLTYRLTNASVKTNEVSDQLAKLQDEVRNQAAPVIDQNQVAREIRQSVADLFSTFKQSSHQFPEVAAKIAEDFPVTSMVAARALFDETCYNDDDGNLIDFGSFEVEVWNDPAAPAIVDDYIFNAASLHQALIALSTEIPHNCWLGGERGTGKTEFVTQVAARLGRKLFRINFDEGLERSEFIGSNTIEGGDVVWKAGTLTQAIRHVGSIILLDEVGFARAQNISPLHAVTERSAHRALVIAETGERIPVARKVVFFAADNSIGHGDESGNFAGVREQNSAFLDRFSFTLRFTYLPHNDEVDLIHKRTGLPRSAGDLLVRFANIARSKAQAGTLTQPPSLRQMFAWAAAVQDGLPVSMAFKNAIINKYPADCEAELQGIYAAVVDAAKLKSYLVRV